MVTKTRKFVFSEFRYHRYPEYFMIWVFFYSLAKKFLTKLYIWDYFEQNVYYVLLLLLFLLYILHFFF